jgi:hypothetical protein
MLLLFIFFIVTIVMIFILSESIANESKNKPDSGWVNTSKCIADDKEKECGKGKITRVCRGLFDKFMGNCVGNNWIDCYINCPIDGGYSDWSKCEGECGYNKSKRVRNCDNPYPQYGGKNCDHLGPSEVACTSSPCPKDCVIDHWQDQQGQPCIIDTKCPGTTLSSIGIIKSPAEYGGKCNNKKYKPCSVNCPIDCNLTSDDTLYTITSTLEISKELSGQNCILNEKEPFQITIPGYKIDDTSKKGGQYKAILCRTSNQINLSIDQNWIYYLKDYFNIKRALLYGSIPNYNPANWFNISLDAIANKSYNISQIARFIPWDIYDEDKSMTISWQIIKLLKTYPQGCFYFSNYSPSDGYGIFNFQSNDIQIDEAHWETVFFWNYRVIDDNGNILPKLGPRNNLQNYTLTFYSSFADLKNNKISSFTLDQYLKITHKATKTITYLVGIKSESVFQFLRNKPPVFDADTLVVGINSMDCFNIYKENYNTDYASLGSNYQPYEVYSYIQLE